MRYASAPCGAGAGHIQLPLVDTLPAIPGRLAQLGERRLDKAEVTGSSPVSPIAFGPVFAGLFAFLGLLAEGAQRLSSHMLPT